MLCLYLLLSLTLDLDKLPHVLNGFRKGDISGVRKFSSESLVAIILERAILLL